MSSEITKSTSAPHANGRQADHTLNPGADINYQRFLECVHCGLCTATCPTYAELGDENDGPRGRIYLMRAVTDGRLELSAEVRQHLDLCLDCRACETACPSGVQYGRLIEPFRVGMEQMGMEQMRDDPQQADDWFQRRILFGLFPYPSKMARLLFPVRVAQRTGLMWLLRHVGAMRLLPERLRQLTSMLPPAKRRGRRLPEILPAVGRPRARVAMFTGCVADVFFRPTHWATVRVLQQNGCDVLVPRTQACCGAIHFHSGASEPARQFADANLAAFKIDEVDAVITNVAGCGAMLKDYGHHWHDELQPQREHFAAKVKDIHEFLDELGPTAPTGEIKLKATYHDACHLVHAQKIRSAPRKLLGLIPGLELCELPESELCCGAAGTYNLTQPEMSQRLSRRKLQNILSTGAQAVITANAGCILQIAREARQQRQHLPIYHPMDLLDLSYRGKKPRG
ncbi:MAG TPA: heterodisulfide reductase-related iron-sulfur binding cluster [Pirellulales bacterium]|nr:heterodisulfide reductase-related iron-sulfur binding cluster [Pirellulales bacterium]